MAQIKIKGRSEILSIPNDVARKIKNRWLGTNGVEKAFKSDSVDLGDMWAGEYGQLISVEIERTRQIPINDIKESDRVRVENNAFRRKSPEDKSQNTDRFKVMYMLKNKFKEPTEEIMQKAREIQFEYFRSHSDEILVPSDLLYPLV